MNETDVPPPTQMKIYCLIVNTIALLQASVDTTNKLLQQSIDILKTLKKDSTKP